jgi:hypothetical protein
MLDDFDVVDGWEEEEEEEEELEKKMNEGKVGEEPYHYPESFVQLLGYRRACLLSPSI